VTASRKLGLPPVVARGTRVLILGSFPGEASLAAKEYYAHPRNHFWPLIGAVLGTAIAAMPYRRRLAALRAHDVGLWDVIVACERRGSLDGAIRNAEHGEIERIRRVARRLALVCFNGKTAARAEPTWRDAGYATLVLPSSSPAYTRPFAEKLVAWHAIGAFLRCPRASPNGRSRRKP
jgi:double-stranded uracil-DNA glycosylase